jgi:hypothetical protein
VTCTKTGSKNDLFLNCRRKRKELSKKELSNVAPASFQISYMACGLLLGIFLIFLLRALRLVFLHLCGFSGFN